MRVTLVSGLRLINSELEVPSQQMMILAGLSWGLASVDVSAGTGSASRSWAAGGTDAIAVSACNSYVDCRHHQDLYK